MVASYPKAMSLLSVLALAAGCASPESGDAAAPYATTRATMRDTVVAATTGDVAAERIHRFEVEWRLRTDTAREIIGEVQGMAVDRDGQVWVWDNATPALWRLAPDGTAMRRIGRAGSGPGEYREGNGVATLRDGRVVLWDDGNSRLNFYGPDGAYRGNAPLAFSDCCGLPLVVDTLNRIWLTTRPRMVRGDGRSVDPAAMIRNEVGFLRYDSAGTLLDTVMAPTLPGRDAPVSAVVTSADDFRGAIRQVPYATYPHQAVSPLGHVVAAMARPYAVHTDANGRPLRITRDFTPPTVSEAERAQQRAHIEFVMRGVRSDFTWNGPPIPRQKPPIAGLFTGLDGRIWVELSVPSESFEIEPAPASSRAQPPPVAFRAKEKRWDVYAPDGQYLGRIAADRSVDLYVTRGSVAWGVRRDANEVAEIVRLRVVPGL